LSRAELDKLCPLFLDDMSRSGTTFCEEVVRGVYGGRKVNADDCGGWVGPYPRGTCAKGKLPKNASLDSCWCLEKLGEAFRTGDVARCGDPAAYGDNLFCWGCLAGLGSPRACPPP